MTGAGAGGSIDPVLVDLDGLVGVEIEHHWLRRSWGQQHVAVVGQVGGPADDDHEPAGEAGAGAGAGAGDGAEVDGTAARPTVLLVHGWPEHWFAWRRVMAALADGARVVAVDLRGFGWSTFDAGLDPRQAVARTTLDDLAADVVALAADLAGGPISSSTAGPGAGPTAGPIGGPSAGPTGGAARTAGGTPPAPLLLVGHDWGGWVSFRAAMARPDLFHHHVAVSIVPPWLDRGVTARRFRSWAYVLPMAVAGDRVATSADAVTALLHVSSTVPWWSTHDGVRAQRSYAERLALPAGAAMSRRLYATLVRHAMPAAVAPARPPRLRVPTTVLVGEDETITHPSMYWSRTYPGELRVVTVAGSRHWVPEERPAAVVGELLALLPT